MNIGKTIKELRIKNEMTQNELANMLGVSMQAVSRWETNITFPDITLLPIIANLFHVTTDELLGVNSFKQDECIKQIINESKEFARIGDTLKRIEVLKKGLKDYPNNYILLENLISALSSFYYANYDEKTSQNDVLREIIELSEKLLKECNDNMIRNRVLQQLCYAYREIGKKDKAIEVATQMASLFECKEVLMSDLLDGEEKIIQAQHIIEGALSLILIESQHKLINDNLDYNNKIYERMNQIIYAVFENKEYGFYNLFLMNNYLELAYNYAILQDIENVITSLTIAVDHASAYQDRTSKKKYTNVLFNMIDDDPKNIIKNTKITEKTVIMNKLNKEEFAFIKNDIRFKEILEKVKELC